MICFHVFNRDVFQQSTLHAIWKNNNTVRNASSSTLGFHHLCSNWPNVARFQVSRLCHETRKATFRNVSRFCDLQTYHYWYECSVGRIPYRDHGFKRVIIYYLLFYFYSTKMKKCFWIMLLLFHFATCVIPKLFVILDQIQTLLKVLKQVGKIIENLAWIFDSHASSRPRAEGRTTPQVALSFQLSSH